MGTLVPDTVGLPGGLRAVDCWMRHKITVSAIRKFRADVKETLDCRIVVTLLLLRWGFCCSLLDYIFIN